MGHLCKSLSLMSVLALFIMQIMSSFEMSSVQTLHLSVSNSYDKYFLFFTFREEPFYS